MDELVPITEAALHARRGDAVSAAAFVRATQADVWRLCAHLSSRDSADDLAQETYARAFASLHRFAGRSSALSRVDRCAQSRHTSAWVPRTNAAADTASPRRA